MEIGAAEYRLAAEEHLRAAGQCHLRGDFLTCHYLCGLAVECILRAYRWRIDSSWDGRHLLPRLYREARFDALVPESGSRNMAENFAVITTRWNNVHRFASPSKLEKHLNNIGATHNIKGDKLKRSSAEMYDAAEYIVALGKKGWEN